MSNQPAKSAVRACRIGIRPTEHNDAARNQPPEYVVS